jgi:hypothetical protein
MIRRIIIALALGVLVVLALMIYLISALGIEVHWGYGR